EMPKLAGELYCSDLEQINQYALHVTSTHAYALIRWYQLQCVGGISVPMITRLPWVKATRVKTTRGHVKLQRAENSQFLAEDDTDEVRTASGCDANRSRDFRRLAAISPGA
ncbi:MAG: hypothetical protein ACREYD_12300, partial [Casimicrobiaceae bacterium]